MKSKYFLLAGVPFILLAIFAYPLGLDNNAQWGASRYVLFGTGLVLSGLYPASVLLRKLQISDKLRLVMEKLWGRLAAPLKTLARPLLFITRSTALSVILAMLVLSSASFYVLFYTSQGYLTKFYDPYNPYVELGEAFLHGQVALLEQPDPRLAAIKDPVNDLAARSKVPFHYDVSYYKGKYYAYWGPVPALLNTAVQAASGKKPVGALAPLIFYAGSGLALAVLLFLLRRWAFPRAPGLSVPLYLLAGLINLPYVFMFTRNNVYETAVLAGQCFLLVGLCGWLAYLVTRRPGWLLLAGAGYALAVGSRYNLALAALIFVGFAAYELKVEGCFSRASLRNGVRRAALLLAPLALMALSLAFYNFARFGSPLQTGFEYQLADPAYQKQFYSPRYISSNLYVYLFYPANLRPDFPFIIENEIHTKKAADWFTQVPGKNYDLEMLGSLPWTPIFWALVFLAPIAVIPLGQKREARDETAPNLVRPAARRFILMLTLAGILEAVHTLLYYYGAMRFIDDFYSLFLIGLVFLSWAVDDRLALWKSPLAGVSRVGLWLVIAALALSTALFGFLISFEVPPQVFRTLNRDMYLKIAEFFNQQASGVYRFIDNPTLSGTILRALIRILR